MQEIIIDKNNIWMILQMDKVCVKQDEDFINALWKYVLYSKNISRTLPECEICKKHTEFVFEGQGGIKKVGNGLMYIPKNKDYMYIVSDIVFHYFYVHKIIPTGEFRDAVIMGDKPESKQYCEAVKKYYCSNGMHTNISSKVKCSYCGNLFEGTTTYRKSRKKRCSYIETENMIYYSVIKNIWVYVLNACIIHEFNQ